MPRDPRDHPGPSSLSVVSFPPLWAHRLQDGNGPKSLTPTQLGRIPPGEGLLLLGDPGVGKTAFLFQAARQARELNPDLVPLLLRKEALTRFQSGTPPSLEGTGPFLILVDDLLPALTHLPAMEAFLAWLDRHRTEAVWVVSARLVHQTILERFLPDFWPYRLDPFRHNVVLSLLPEEDREPLASWPEALKALGLPRYLQHFLRARKAERSSPLGQVLLRALEGWWRETGGPPELWPAALDALAEGRLPEDPQLQAFLEASGLWVGSGPLRPFFADLAWAQRLSPEEGLPDLLSLPESRQRLLWHLFPDPAPILEALFRAGVDARRLELALELLGEDEEALLDILAPHLDAQEWFQMARLLRERRNPKGALAALERGMQAGLEGAEVLHLRGLLQGELGNWAEAVRDLEAALREDPHNLAVTEDLARGLLQLGIVDRAIERLHPVLEEAERRVQALRHTLAQAYLKAGRPEAVRALLEASLRAAPEDQEGLALLAQAYLELGQPQKAEELLRQGLRYGPHTPQLHYLLARALADQGREEEALAHSRKSLVGTDDPEPWIFQGELLARMGRWEEALQILSEVSTPKPPRLLAALARLYRRWGKQKRALQTYRAAYNQGARDAEFLLEFGEVLLEEGETQRALWILQEGIQRHPQTLDLWIRFSRLLLDLGRWTEVRELVLQGLRALRDPEARRQLLREVIQKALEVGSLELASDWVNHARRLSEARQDEDPEMWILQGEVALHRGDVDEALRWFRKGIEARPTPAWIRRAARAALEAGRLEEAEDLVEAVRGLEPDHPETWLLEGLLARARGEPDRALDALRKGLRVPRETGLLSRQEGQIHLAELLLSQGKPEDALEILSEASPGPFRLQAHRLRLRALEALDRTEEAWAEIQAALELAPEDPELLLQAGRLALEVGRPEQAEAHLQEALIHRSTPELHRTLARALAWRGKVQGALAHLLQAVQEDPKPEDAPLLSHLGRALGQVDLVLPALEVLKERFPDHPAVAGARARAFLALNQERRARSCLETYQLDRPEHEEPLLAWAELALRSRNLVSAAHLLEEAFRSRGEALARSLRSGPFPPEALREARSWQELTVDRLLLLGRLWERQERLPQVRQLYNFLLKQSPFHPEVRLALARVFLRLNRPRDALTVLQTLQESHPEDPRPLLWAGRALLALRRIQEAREVLERARELVPEEPEVWALLAQALEAQGERQAALEHLRKAVSLNPRQIRWRRQLVKGLRDQGAWEEAFVEIRGALQRNPRDVQAWELLALLEKDLGNLEQAWEAIQRALNLRPDSAHLWRQAAEIALERKDLKAATQAARRARTLAPEEPEGAYLEFQIREAQGDGEGALQALKKAVELRPAASTWVRELARRLLEAGRAREAIPHLERLLELNPEDVEATLALARAWRAVGKPERSLELLAKVRKSAPPRSEERVQAAREEAQVYLGGFSLPWTFPLPTLPAEVRQRFQKGLTLLEEAARQDPAFHFARAEALLALGRPYQALVALDATPTAAQDATYWARRAQTLAILDRWQEAFSLLEQKVEERPQEPVLWGLLGVLLVHKHKAQIRAWPLLLERSGHVLPSRAIQALRRAVQLDPKEPAWHQALLEALAAAHYWEGLAQEAARIWEAEGDRPSWTALFYLALAQIHQGRRLDALKKLDRIPADAPEALWARWWAARVLHHLGRHKEAEERYQEIRPQLSEPLRALLDVERAQNFLKGGQEEAAARTARHALSLGQNLPEVVEQATQILWEADFQEEAIRTLEQACETFPLYALHEQLARWLWERGERGAAEERLYQALQRSPNPEGFLLLAEWQEALGMLDQARAYLKRLRKEKPHDPEILRRLARIEWRLGQRGEARRTLAALLESGEDRPEDRILYGQILAELGLWAQARTTLEQGVEEAETPEGRFWGTALLVRALRMEGHLEEAERRLAEVREGIRTHPDLSREWAWFRWARGHPREAIAHLRWHVRRFPEDLEGVLDLAQMLLEKGTLQEAEALLEQVEARKGPLSLPLQARLLYLRARGHLRRRRPNVLQALSAVRQAQDLDPRSEYARLEAQLLADLGEEERGHLEEACRIWERLIHQEGSRPEDRLQLAEALQRLGRYEEALNRLAPLLEIEGPHLAPALELAGLLAYQLGQEDQAFRYLRARQRLGGFEDGEAAKAYRQLQIQKTIRKITPFVRRGGDVPSNEDHNEARR